MKIIAIHQPNFFPWLGYFDKIIRADMFILLDHVQFSKTGGTWINRVQLLINGHPAWVTLPIVRAYHGTRRVNEMLINNATDWRNKLLKSLQMNYAHTQYFSEIYPFLETLIQNPTEDLADYNVSNIRALIQALGISSEKMILSSAHKVSGVATEMLIELVRAEGGDAYLCGGGASGYQADEKFVAAGIKLIYQNFQHPVYHQVKSRDFVSGLSIIDALLNCGVEGTKQILLKRHPPAR